MARLYKRGRVWWCWYYDAGKRQVCASTRCTDRKAAEVAAARLEREAADPRHAASHATTLRGALEQLLAERRTRGRAAGTLSMYATKGGHLTRLLGGDTSLAQLTASTVDAFVSARLDEGASRNTIGKELTTLRSALKIAKRRGQVVADLEAIMPVQWSTGYRPRTRLLRSGEELQKLVDELTPDRGAHAVWMVATGCRDGETTRARRADVDMERGIVHIRGTKTEASEDAIPIVAFMRPLLEHVLSVRGDVTGPMFRPWGNVRRDLADACSRAGLEAVTPNDLRRTFATWLHALGIDTSLVARALRHRDSRMVERVYGRLPASAAGAVMRARLGEADPCSAGVVAEGGLAGPEAQGGQSTPRNFVPRDGVEPPTRGFSIPPPRRRRGEEQALAVVVRLRRVAHL